MRMLPSELLARFAVQGLQLLATLLLDPLRRLLVVVVVVLVVLVVVMAVLTSFDVSGPVGVHVDMTTFGDAVLTVFLWRSWIGKTRIFAYPTHVRCKS